MRGTCESSGLNLKLPRISVDFHTYEWVWTAWLELPTHILVINAYTWVLSSLEGASLLPMHMLVVLRICVGSGACWHVDVTFELVKTVAFHWLGEAKGRRLGLIRDA
ncbi:hypothetical protein PIB30_032538 [Stylosanthes scabra]|uniref:Uncharacterized protein n=1 Tax=Stylosanthes scabra TaxID=79078 RepID=A0ABU6YCG6_9FABA|nr:hypothetical protein [Stylosanthes scabra]